MEKEIAVLTKSTEAQLPEDKREQRHTKTLLHAKAGVRGTLTAGVGIAIALFGIGEIWKGLLTLAGTALAVVVWILLAAFADLVHWLMDWLCSLRRND